MTAAIVTLTATVLILAAAAVATARGALRARTELADERAAHAGDTRAHKAERDRLREETTDSVARMREARDRLAAHEAELAERALPQLEGFRCLLHTQEYGTVRGVVERVYADAYLVSHAEYLESATPAGQLAGATLIPRSPEPMVQRLEPFDVFAQRPALAGVNGER